MIGSIGFVLASIMFLAYGFSANKLAKPKKNFDHKSYFIAYIFVAIACLVWGLGMHLGKDLINQVVIVGDCLLFGAIIALVVTSAKKKEKVPALIVGIITFSLLLAVRLLSPSIDPVIRDGVLVFNTPRIFGTILSLAILIVWVKTNMAYFKEAVPAKLQAILRPSYFSMNVLGFIGVTGFLFARKNLTIIVSFSMIVISFAVLTSLNYYVLSLKKGAKHGK